MKAYKIEILVLDFDGLGGDEIKFTIEDTRYPNRCISPTVKDIQEVDIGPWEDSHPLNNCQTCDAEYKRLFGNPKGAA